MTATKLIEYNIARQLLQRRSQQTECVEADDFSSGLTGVQTWADRVIAVLALTVCLVVVGSYAEELL